MLVDSLMSSFSSVRPWAVPCGVSVPILVAESIAETVTLLKPLIINSCLVIVFYFDLFDSGLDGHGPQCGEALAAVVAQLGEYRAAVVDNIHMIKRWRHTQ